MNTNQARGAVWLRLLLLTILVLTVMIPQTLPVRAATEILYVPETGHYVRGVFRDFWDNNGGLANFGFPITEEYIEPANGRVVQYFERARFERETAEATEVTLGLLGREFLGTRAFAPSEPIPNSDDRRYIPETGHIIQYGFKDIWESRGGANIFGFPLSDEVDEQLSDGQTYTVQYFERARFEYRPTLPPGERVVISDLGRILAPQELTAPLPPDNPPPGPITIEPAPEPPPPPAPAPEPPPPPAPAPMPTPTPEPAPEPTLVRPEIPESVNSRMVPRVGVRGQTFLFDASGFEPDERVTVWLNVPDGTVLPLENTVSANDQGSIVDEGVGFFSTPESPVGIWSFVGRGDSSGNTAIGYFLILDSVIGRSPPPDPGVPPNRNAQVEPSAGQPETIFVLDAFGFQPGEPVGVFVVASDGTRIDADFTVSADGQGSIGYAGVYFVTNPGYPLGLYAFEAVGQVSNRTSTGYFVLTP